MRPPLLLLLAAALVLPACAQEAEAPSEAHRKVSESAPELDPAFDPHRERATKKQWQQRASGEAMSHLAIKKRISEINWDEARSFERADLEGLHAEQRARLLDAPVPALVPNRAELFGEATVTGGEHWYAVSLDGDAHSVYVSGTRLVTVVEGLELDDSKPDLKDDFRITRTDGIVSLSVNAFGAAYTLEVECARPGTDLRCRGDEYVVSLANALVLPREQELPGGPTGPKGGRR